MTERQDLWDWLHDSNFKWDCVSDEAGVVRIIFFVEEKDGTASWKGYTADEND